MTKKKLEEKKKQKTMMLKESTIEFLENGIPNIENGAAVDELVRRHKEFKGKPTNTYL